MTHDDPVVAWTLSASDPRALRGLAGGLRERLASHPDLTSADIGLSLATEREHARHRAVLIGGGRAELFATADALAHGEPAAAMVRGTTRSDSRPVLVFPGQGWQWASMAALLRDAFPVFATTLAECDAALRPLAGCSVSDAVITGVDATVDDVALFQPAMWAVMVSLAELWRSVGVAPAAVLGHSQGMTAAAVAAGALSIEDGARIVTTYAELIKHELSGHGGMVLLGLGAEDARRRIASWDGRLSVAAANSPASTVVSGDRTAIDELLAACREHPTWARRIQVDYAPHSRLVDPLIPRLRERLGDITPTPHSRVPIYSTVTGGPVPADRMDTDFWVANLRETIRFDEALNAALADGYRLFVETSAHPVLAMGMQEIFDASPADAAVSETLRRDDGGRDRFVTSAAQVWANGGDVDWDALFAGTGARRADVPEPSAAETGAGESLPGLDSGDAAQRRARLLDLVRRHAAAVLGHDDPARIDDEVSFRDAGFDSARAVELRGRLNTALGLSLPAAVLYSHPTPIAVAQRVFHDLYGEPEAPDEPEPVAVDEPVAIVGMACRFPGGVASPEDLWRLVVGEVDAVGDFPVDRGWDLGALLGADGVGSGSSSVGRGGFLSGAGDFDAGFFGISPREAAAMDPQQRLMLEVSWEALESARIDPNVLRGSETGVFAGTADAGGQGHVAGLDQAPAGYEGQLITGTAGSVLSGRIAYCLGLTGPAVTVDTACSSSLVSLHLAAQALRAGDCSLALAGGATVMTNPGMFTEFSRQGGLAPDGRCKSFGAGADGTGWAEGVGVVVVERLSDAVSRGHEVLAVLAGSAVNQDGASNGLSAPNGAAQQRVIRRALARAELRPDDVDVVEAHGTGTALGDPVEADALLASYGRDRDRPLYLGSLKSNIGHAQAAAGVGGVIKMVMALRHGVLPRSLHCDELSSEVDWSAGGVEVLRRTRPWPRVPRPRRAGVSSFGISGTNAHVILEQAPEPEVPPVAEATPVLTTDLVPLPVSGHSGQALRAQANRLADHIDADSPGMSDLAHALASTRATFRHRGVLLATDRADVAPALRAFGAGADVDAVVSGVADIRGKVAFVFPGQGWQWHRMGKELAETSPVFSARLSECAEALRPYTDGAAVDLIVRGHGDASGLDDMHLTHCAAWAVMVSLAELWRSVGVEPAAVVGHSMGELAAATVCGALSLADAAKLTAFRSRLLRDELTGRGAMAAVGLSADATRRRITPWGDRLSVGLINGPSSTVVSGAPDALAEFIGECERDHIDARRVSGPQYAPHSAQVERIRDQLLEVFADIDPRPSAIPFYSTVTGRPLPTGELDTEYWYHNLRRTVQFDGAIRAMLDDGFGFFVECSAHPTLGFHLDETIRDTGANAVALETLRRAEGGPARFLASVAAGQVRGLPGVDWQSLLPADHRPIDLPTYPFQRDRYWLTPGRVVRDDGHPLLDTVTTLAGTDGALLLTATLSRDTAAWLADADPVRCGAVLLELALYAGGTTGYDRVERLTMREPLRLTEKGRVDVQVMVAEPEDGLRPVTVYSRTANEPDAAWRRNADGTLAVSHGDTGTRDRPVHTGTVDAGTETEHPAVRALWWRADELCADLSLPEDLTADADRFRVHPVLLDAVSRALSVAKGDQGTRIAPSTWSGVELYAVGATTLRLGIAAGEADTLAIDLADHTGAPVARVESVVVEPAPDPIDDRDDIDRHLFQIEWLPTDAGTDTEPPSTIDDPTSITDLPEPVPGTVAVRLGGTGLEETAERGLRLIQDWLAADRCRQSRLVFVLAGDTPVTAAVAGLVRSAQAEHPGRFGLVHTLDDATPVVTHAEPETRVHDGRVTVPRLTRLDPRPAPNASGRWRPDATVLITGGTGTLGGLLARHLVENHGVRDLTLLSRRGPAADGAAELVADLETTGARVRVEACDSSDSDALRRVITGIDRLGAVIHAAGVLEPALIEQLTPRQLRTVLRAKAEAARHLDALTADRDLDAFVLYSSISGSTGAAYQAGYTAANSYLDGLARDRRRRGLPAVSLAWGLWEQATGLTQHLNERDIALIGKTGIAPMDTTLGLALFDAALDRDLATVVAAPLDLAVLRRLAAAGEAPPIFHTLTGTPKRRAAATGTGPAAGRELADRLKDEPSVRERHKVLLDLVRSHAATVLGLSEPSDIEPGRAFRDAGFDSLAGVRLRDRLTAATGLPLAKAIVFQYPNPTALADHLHAELVGDVSTSKRVLDDLDKLRTAAAEIDTRDTLRATITQRLRALLYEFEGDVAAFGDDNLESATDEDIFALMDKELGDE